MRAGKRNLITDIAGLRVGHAHDVHLKSGVTALICDVANISSVHVMGGAPGSRDTDLLQPENTVQSVDGFALSGGSAFGLDAASGVQAALREDGKGFQIGDQRVPIVPAAILFDLINGGKKDWGQYPPYRELGYEAARNASIDFDLGSTGAGTGALVGGKPPGLKGGLGSASTALDNSITIGALVAVNALGAATVGDSKHFWAQPFEIGDEFGGFGPSPIAANEAQEMRIKMASEQSKNKNTTIAIIATDAILTKGEAKRLAVAAHDGFARALWPAHTPLDGDLIFSVATSGSGVVPSINEQIEMSALAATTMSRAIARGIYEATAEKNDLFPSWAKVFGSN